MKRPSGRGRVWRRGDDGFDKAVLATSFNARDPGVRPELLIEANDAGDVQAALQLAREALRIFQATLPPTHPHLQQAREVVRQFEGDSARRA